jgi:hypothetical protein
VWPWRYSCNDVAKKEIDLRPFRATLKNSRIDRASRFGVWVPRNRTSWDCEARGQLRVSAKILMLPLEWRSLAAWRSTPLSDWM